MATSGPREPFDAWAARVRGPSDVLVARLAWPLAQAWLAETGGDTRYVEPPVPPNQRLVLAVVEVMRLTGVGVAQLLAAQVGDFSADAGGAVTWTTRHVGRLPASAIVLTAEAEAAFAALLAARGAPLDSLGAHDQLIDGAWTTRRLKYAVSCAARARE